MTYELTIPLKRGHVEIEFDDLDELDQKLANLDVKRLDAIVTARLRGRAPKKAAAKKTPTRKASAKTTKKSAKRARTTKKTAS